MFREIPLLLLIGGMIGASRNISVSFGDLKQPEDCQDFLTRFEVNSKYVEICRNCEVGVEFPCQITSLESER